MCSKDYWQAQGKGCRLSALGILDADVLQSQEYHQVLWLLWNRWTHLHVFRILQRDKSADFNLELRDPSRSIYLMHIPTATKSYHLYAL